MVGAGDRGEREEEEEKWRRWRQGEEWKTEWKMKGGEEEKSWGRGQKERRGDGKNVLGHPLSQKAVMVGEHVELLQLSDPHCYSVSLTPSMKRISTKFWNSSSLAFGFWRDPAGPPRQGWCTWAVTQWLLCSGLLRPPEASWGHSHKDSLRGPLRGRGVPAGGPSRRPSQESPPSHFFGFKIPRSPEGLWGCRLIDDNRGFRQQNPPRGSQMVGEDHRLRQPDHKQQRFLSSPIHGGHSYSHQPLLELLWKVSITGCLRKYSKAPHRPLLYSFSSPAWPRVGAASPGEAAGDLRYLLSHEGKNSSRGPAGLLREQQGPGGGWSALPPLATWGGYVGCHIIGLHNGWSILAIVLHA